MILWTSWSPAVSSVYPVLAVLKPFLAAELEKAAMPCVLGEEEGHFEMAKEEIAREKV